MQTQEMKSQGQMGRAPRAWGESDWFGRFNMGCGAVAAIAGLLWGGPLLAKPGELDPAPPAALEDGLLEVEPPRKPSGGAEVYFDEDSWRALVEGKTLYYRTSEGIVGREYYPPGGNAAIFEYYGDKSCFEGSWSYTKDRRFCFLFDGKHCFYHLQRDGEIYARQMDGKDQKVIMIKVEPFSCAKGLTS